MTPEEIKDILIEIIKEKKTEDLTVVNVSEQTEIADYMIIMTGKTNLNVRMLSEHIEEQAEKKGLFATRKDGVREGRWIVMDYASVIVHIFNRDMRNYFNLEALWAKDGNVTKIED